MQPLQTYDSTCSTQERRLFRFAHLIGLSEDAICFLRCENWSDVLSKVDSMDRRPLVVELSSDLHAWPPQAFQRIARCGPVSRHVFVFRSRSSDAVWDQELCPRGLAQADRTSALSEVRFSEDALWGPLRGLSADWSVSLNSGQEAFTELSTAWSALITVGGAPWFLRGAAAEATAFLWAGADLPDLSELLTPDEECDQLLRLLPLLAFFRQAFGQKTWHAPEYFANLMIDDPPVRDRYGFFEPARHIASLADISQATTIGFIPWNWNRSTSTAAELFRAHRSQLSLCIHGCDHTEHEFASLDRATLLGKCQLALDRAERLRLRTGLNCEPVMIFPQGRFSKAAVAALRETDFLAAAASTIFPVDSVGGEVSLEYLLEPAFTGFEDFPIFTRRYPRDLARCAVDLYLGRPLVLVEHQEYFNEGYEKCRQFLKAINSLDCKITWAPLHEVIQRACLQREIEPGFLEVRYFSGRFILENPSSEKVSYRALRRWIRPGLIRRVLVNGSPVPYAFENGQITILLNLDPRTSATVQLVQIGPRTKNVFKGDLLYRTLVWIRRFLGDLRAGHVWMSSLVRWIGKARHRGGTCT